MFGSGDMFLPAPGDPVSVDKGDTGSTDDMFSVSSSSSQMLLFDDSPSPTPKMWLRSIFQTNSVRNTHPEINRTEVKFVDKPQRRVKEIRVFYDDQTWETFVPEKK